MANYEAKELLLRELGRIGYKGHSTNLSKSREFFMRRGECRSR
jgi:hypothetical protein